MQDCNARLITDSTNKANSINFNYASVFGCERNIPQITQIHSGKPFTINIKMIRNRLAAIGRNKSIGSDGFSWGHFKTGCRNHDSVSFSVAGRNN